MHKKSRAHSSRALGAAGWPYTLWFESFQKNTNHGGQLARQTEEERYYNTDIGGITLVRNRKEATMMIQQ